MANGETLTFRIELPDSRLKFPQIKYRPNTDYAITPPPNQEHIDDYLHSAEASTMSMDYIIIIILLQIVFFLKIVYLQTIDKQDYT